MFYKLSNTASAQELEEYFGTPLRYPNLYTEEAVIDGLKESNLIIKTRENPNFLETSIWGILPERYTGEWQTFQTVKNTLNFNIDVMKNDKCFKESLFKRRCLIPITGFFTAYISDGEIFSHYVYLSSKKPFCLAGVYNRLSDGFLTCSVLLSNNSQQLSKIQNLTCEMPLIVSRKDSRKWLDHKISDELIDEILYSSQKFMLSTHPVTSNLYNGNYSGNEFLVPKSY